MTALSATTTAQSAALSTLPIKPMHNVAGCGNCSSEEVDTPPPRYTIPHCWPQFHPAVDIYSIICGPETISWLVREKTFYFRVNSCFDPVLHVPLLYLFTTQSGIRRTERFRAGDVRIVGCAKVSGGIAESSADRNTVYAAVELIRISKAEFEFLRRQSILALPRGRRPDAKLRLEDFAPTREMRAALTHWLQNPVKSSPYAAIVEQFLPEELVSRCAALSFSDPAHPFATYVRAPFSDENGASDLRHVRPLLPELETRFTFIDLFAGIGGFRLAMQQEGGKCVFASEIDQNARDTYERNFRVLPFGDITSDETKGMIPQQFDVLCGGFPCQAFSMAGKREGIEDALQRGTLYREIVEIARCHRPKALLCENVRGLLNAHKGRDWSIIRAAFEGAGYRIIFENILNSKDYGVPQNRERLYIVALRDDFAARADALGLAFPKKPPRIPGPIPRCIGDIRERDPARVSKSFYLGESYLQTLIRHKAKHRDQGQSGFGFIVRNDDDIAGTLMCGGMGRERNMLQDPEDFQPDWMPPAHMKGSINAKRYRFMTIRERARLQGFPDCFRIPDSISAGQKQFGNCVTVSVVRAVGRTLVNFLKQIEESVNHG